MQEKLYKQEKGREEIKEGRREGGREVVKEGIQIKELKRDSVILWKILLNTHKKAFGGNELVQ